MAHPFLLKTHGLVGVALFFWLTSLHSLIRLPVQTACSLNLWPFAYFGTEHTRKALSPHPAFVHVDSV